MRSQILPLYSSEIFHGSFIFFMKELLTRDFHWTLSKFKISLTSKIVYDHCFLRFIKNKILCKKYIFFLFLEKTRMRELKQRQLETNTTSNVLRTINYKLLFFSLCSFFLSLSFIQWSIPLKLNRNEWSMCCVQSLQKPTITQKRTCWKTDIRVKKNTIII